MVLNIFLNFIKKTRNKIDIIKFFNRLKFQYLFLFWIFIIIFFGIIYHLLNLTQANSLIYLNEIPLQNNIQGFLDSLYFSFITATATGYGDIIGTGLAKLLAVFEVIIGLVIFGILISKLVSYKQSIILEEIYEISFDEKINRLRSALYLFRADVARFIEKINSKILNKQKLQDLWILLASCENNLDDIEKLLCPKIKKEYLKNINELKFELLLNSIDLTLLRLKELLNYLDENEFDWMHKRIIDTLKKIVKSCRSIEKEYKYKKMGKKIKLRINGISKYLFDIETIINQNKI